MSRQNLINQSLYAQTSGMWARVHSICQLFYLEEKFAWHCEKRVRDVKSMTLINVCQNVNDLCEIKSMQSVHISTNCICGF